ncbi:GNAT family N-acetyltransferase [Clostridium transplantifaecale]|uniref:GNAT family N-acetyltransferase n=1 Tax=Clostridium transplantifaecale TaxID=2479838 RepID=UPI000F635C0B|nr:GNAT family N-acetyltransferase [Clostridium transplantifaecale]
MEILPGELYIEEIKELIREYTNSLKRDLTFQNLDEELNDIKAKYTDHDGKLLAAFEDGKAIGCIALRRFDENRCEMKRLFVKPEYRGRRAGQALVEEIIKNARNMGYHSMLLDTVTPLQSAVKLYHIYGFREIPAYYENPMPDAIFMELKL